MTQTPEDARLLARAAQWTGPESNLAELNAGRLLEIANREGLDFATALLYGRLHGQPDNAVFIHRAKDLEQAMHIDAEVIGIVPGAFHREHRHTGADGERILRIARELGCPAEVIPTASFGTLEENARTIGEWLAAHRGKRIALLSLSKGSADLKIALSQPEAPERFADVAAWVSLSGTVQGSPLVRWLRQRPLRWWAVHLLLWWKGHPAQALRDLSHGSGTRLESWPEALPHLRIVHVYGFPLQRHLSHRWAPKAYARLRPLGPNDGGGILLADLAALPGIVCPIWGADHYLMPAWDIVPRLRGIVTAALSREAPLHASQSATQPSTMPAIRSIT